MGISQREMGEILGIDQTQVSRLESEQLIPKAPWFVRLYLIDPNDLETADLLTDLWNQFNQEFSKFYGGPKKVLSSASSVEKGRPRGKTSGAVPKGHS